MAKALAAEGIAVEITPQLQEAIDEEWAWADYPMPWCTRGEVRWVSDQAQKIHDDIQHGRLLIHAHARDGHTTVAVGTYLHQGGKSVYLHGENHLRQVADTFDSLAEAMTAFKRVHASEMRLGPASLTDTERAAIAARSVNVTTSEAGPSHPGHKTVPVYLADPGDHDALLDRFLDKHGEFQKWRTWSDETTHAIHESQTLRIEHVHEADAHETVWTVAAYETPVSDRMWVLTATGATPAPALQVLLTHLADGEGRDTRIDGPVDEQTATAATRPLTEAGWEHSLTTRGLRRISPDGEAGVQFDPLTSQHPQNPATWTIWAGTDPDQPTWAISASPRTPTSLITGLCDALANETVVRQYPLGRERARGLVTPAPTPTVMRPAGRSR
ncbi:DUF317 domain-containing protein [Streptomyces sp. NPDC057682]|uniref:DUF317 domain-containing protein n=1 Tax=Streptomyces sp. NPDC057682 TaxID=3346210 RepID=UPI0036A4A40C